MRVVASRAMALAIAACLFGLSDCHRGPAAAAPGAGTVHATAAGEPSRAPHLRVAALVPKGPVTLTSSDGKGLSLASLSARAVLVGPLAFTEVHLAFVNPEPRTIEGTFAITLPQRASISRFAMRMGDAWQEGEVVERMRAREAFEDFLHRKRDPALLEQAAGNQFSARVFPIPASGTKEIVVSYAQELRGDEPYVLPLRGLPEVGAVELSAVAEGGNLSLATRREQRWAPDADFVVDRASLAAAGGLRSGDLVLARVRPALDERPDPVGSAIVLVDTSASLALDVDARAAQLGAVAARIAARSPSAALTVACFDQEVVEAYSGSAAGFGSAEIDRVRGRAALGASGLARALAWARERARTAGARRVVLVSDGVATAGATQRSELVAAAKALGDAGVERLDAIATGGIRDDAVLAALVRAGLARDGVVVGADADADETARRLVSATRSSIDVKVAGATWWTPRMVDGAQPGDEVLVYAQVPEGAPVAVSVGGAPAAAVDLRSVERPLLERAWAQAKIASLLDASAAPGAGDATERARREIVELSTRHRVLSPYTALLVLESEGDYARFHIDRRALPDVLVVQGSRVAATHRTDPVLGPAAQPKIVPRAGEAARLGPDPSSARGNMWGASTGDASGAGGLGLSGVGEAGGGRGEGIGMGTLGHGAGRLGGAHVARAPAVRMGAAAVSGRLPPEVIQRIVRQSFGRFRACYETALRSRPDLRGRVAIRFVIDRTGAVPQASDAGSDVGDAAFVACVAREFESLSFPRPEGGVITVVYPMTFSGGGVETAVAAAQPPPSAADVPAAERPRDDTPVAGEPYAGRFADVMRSLAGRDARSALGLAWAWHDEDPGDVLALVALGEALEASGETATATRAYGSIIDLFPSSVDLRRMAGERLERLRRDDAARLAADDYAKAVADRPDHPSSHRMLAYARLKQKDYAGAFEAAVAGLAYRYPGGRFAGVERILRDDVGLVGAAWAAAEPAKADDIAARVRSVGGTPQAGPSLRFVLSWESDANDVDLHVRDAEGHHAFFQDPRLPGGGELYADVTTGYGPECFAIEGPRGGRSARYSLQVQYYSRGPMGYGMGKVEIVEHDGHGGLTFDERPFVVMNDHAFVDLGDVL